MGLTLENIVRNAKVDAAMGIFDGGTIELQTSGDVEVATLALSNPAADGSAASGTVDFDTITQDSSATGGTATKGKIKTSGAALAASFTVGTGGADLNLDNNVIGAGVSVAITSLSYTQPAS